MTAVSRPDASDLSSKVETLSSLADGECQADAALEACGCWRTDAEMRGKWHAYQLIGDVLRSEELGNSASHDQAFLQQLRSRLAQEPVPLATAPLVPAKPRRWMASVAVVAGFVVVGVTVVALGPADNRPTGWNNPVAQTDVVADQVMRRVSGAAPTVPQTWVIDGQVIRDARLDAYFDAHRGAVGAAPTALPGGALRSVEILVPRR